ncbi:MAG: AMP-binding protein [Solirubrobacterales bacterium]
MTPLGALRDLVADAGFDLSVLARAGILGPDRRDRAIRAVAALVAGGQTLPTALRVATIKHPERTLIEDRDGSLTYSEVDRRVTAIASGLIAEGLRPGHSVAILCRNGRGLVEAVLGVAKAGLDVVLLNTMFSGPQVQDVVEAEGVSAIVFDPEFEEIAAGLEGIELSIVTGRDSPGDRFAWLESLANGPATPEPPRREDPPRFVILTSGTTGRPRGAPRSTASGLSGMAALIDRIPRRSGESVVIAAPLFHSWGFVNFALSLTLGATVILDGRFDPGRTVELLDTHAPETLIAVPVMLQRMVEWAEAEGMSQAPHRPRIASVSGSVLPGRLATDWMDRFGENLYSLYGSTEVAFVSVAGPSELRADPGTAGRPVRGTSVRLLDREGRDVPPGEEGRIFVRNEMAFEGYSDGSDKERVEGFVSTGDVGHFEGGLLRVDGRDDEMIVSGGENVFPREVEDEIAAMDGVVEVAVIGVDDDRFGQALVAHVVGKPGEEPDSEEIRAHVRERLASFKVPREVVFLDRLPRNETGKVVKRHLGG